MFNIFFINLRTFSCFKIVNPESSSLSFKFLVQFKIK